MLVYTFPSLSIFCTGESLSEALILASTNQQYDERLFIELQVQYMFFVLTFRTIDEQNMYRACSFHVPN